MARALRLSSLPPRSTSTTLLISRSRSGGMASPSRREHCHAQTGTSISCWRAGASALAGALADALADALGPDDVVDQLDQHATAGEQGIALAIARKRAAAEPAHGLRPRALHLHYGASYQPCAGPYFAQHRRGSARIRGGRLGQRARHRAALWRFYGAFPARAVVDL